jgi:ABC-2 type transport system ATP-binding protein
LQSVEGRIAHFIVPQDHLPSMISRILADLDVVDLTITDPPVEEVISRVFEAGSVM